MLLALTISSVLTISAFITGLAAGIMTATLGFLLCALFIRFSKSRYDKIAAMSAQIDRILHGHDTLEISGYDEGELSIMQNELQKVTVRLREQADNLAKDKLNLADSLADIAHQIRTPLTSINLLASLLARQELADTRRLELIRELETLLSRIDWLIITLLKISKIDAGTAIFRAAPIPLVELIDKALEPFTIPLEIRNVTLSKSISGSVNCDPAWTAEALGNIVKNCLEHVENKGVIRIETEQNPLYIQIVISDNGSGFDDDDLPHLFERFYKGKNEGNNNFGIGLALSRMIIMQQNGTIKAEKNKPCGARFVIKFYDPQTI